jgi:hypothetical protein
MRSGSNTFSNQKRLSEKTINNTILKNQSKNIRKSLSDNFFDLSAWEVLRGNWSTTGSQVSSSSTSSSYPILLSYDIKSQNISATALTSRSGAGIVFWLSDENNWWAGFPFYTTESETFVSGSFSCNCTDTGRAWGYYKGRPLFSQDCNTCYTYSTRTRYRYYLRLVSSISGSVSTVGNIELFNSLDTSDNISGVRVITNGNSITASARTDSGTFFGSSISVTPSSPNRGFRSGIIFAPGGFTESSVFTSFSIEAL